MVRLLAVPSLLLGSATAYAAVLVHTRWWGLLLGLAACACTLVALPGRWWGRLAFAAGWVAVVALAALPRAEGDYLVAADTAGYSLLVATLVVVLGSLVTLGGRRTGSLLDQEDRPQPT
ncbi:hypothetical protein [uncultured Nocardioides sp.]|uniref:hypothetical protein n=1 Tax=uncultured Nocardioides sp. TaxID=198441 RepID=UPI0025F2B968|nr:hypothetical protein [uncultured Nocardioides sp.]